MPQSYGESIDSLVSFVVGVFSVDEGALVVLDLGPGRW